MNNRNQFPLTHPQLSSITPTSTVSPSDSAEASSSHAAPNTTVLRVKRRRAETSVDALHVNVPSSKRARIQGEVPCLEQPYVRFRRVNPQEGNLNNTTSQIVDVDRALIYPEPLDEDEDDDMLWDLYTRETASTTIQQHATVIPHQKIVYVSIADLPLDLIDEASDDASDDASLSDHDAHSVDYPSTPPHSFDSWHSPRNASCSSGEREYCSEDDHDYVEHFPDDQDLERFEREQFDYFDHEGEGEENGWR